MDTIESGQKNSAGRRSVGMSLVTVAAKTAIHLLALIVLTAFLSRTTYDYLWLFEEYETPLMAATQLVIDSASIVANYWYLGAAFCLFVNPLILVYLELRAAAWLRAIWFVTPLLLALSIIGMGSVVLSANLERTIDKLVDDEITATQ
jgi:hypothetical protein